MRMLPLLHCFGTNISFFDKGCTLDYDTSSRRKPAMIKIRLTPYTKGKQRKIYIGFLNKLQSMKVLLTFLQS